MADLAMVFHWEPQAMDGMDLEELMEWRERARKRHEGNNPNGNRSK
ncbi:MULTISPECIES: GpE family phage tail protein [unclassified Halomonas]|nr:MULTISPECIES: GpE family phage tail protein [unclassified Halomonas]AQU84917.1 acetyltransferase [Halomonas sp. 'Soap Lake \